MKMPVYLFTGFLEGGKSTLIQESLEDERFNSGEKTLLILCEEGEVEFDSSRFWGKNVNVEIIDDESELTREKLESLTRGRVLDRIIIEYNGMWLLEKLYAAMPKGWSIYQNVMLADAASFANYNANMRQLVYDKIVDAEMVVLNRTPDDLDKDEIHKIIRAISRRANIVYDYPDGHVEYDEIEDPLPFDLEADEIEIGDGDYAVWYRDLSENMSAYADKNVKFRGLVAKDGRMDKFTAIAGRHVMTCCEDDIQYCGLACVFKNPPALKTRDWVIIRGKLRIENNGLYNSKGPVIHVESYELTSAPKQELATFY